MLDIRDHGGMFVGVKELKGVSYQTLEAFSSPVREVEFDLDNGEVFIFNGNGWIHYKKNTANQNFTAIKSTSEATVVGYYKDYVVKFITATNKLQFYTHANQLIREITVPNPNSSPIPSVCGGCMFGSDKILYVRQVFTNDWSVYDLAGNLILSNTVQNSGLRAFPMLNKNKVPMFVAVDPTTSGGVPTLNSWMGSLNPNNTVEQLFAQYGQRYPALLMMRFMYHYLKK